MNQEAPDKSLSRIYVNLEKLKHSEDDFAFKIQERLRIIVSWIITSKLCFPICSHILYDHNI